MPAFSLARLQEDIVGRRMTSERVAGYMDNFAAFNTGQLRHLSGKLGLPDPSDREAALESLNSHLMASFDSAFPVATGDSEKGAGDEPAKEPDNKTDYENPGSGGKICGAGGKTSYENPGNGGNDKEALWEGEGANGGPGKGGKTSYENPGNGGNDKEALWEGEGANGGPGKGGKTSYENPGNGGNDKEALWEGEGANGGPGKGGKTSAPPEAEQEPVAEKSDDKKSDNDDVAEPLTKCPGCPDKTAAMGVDIGNDGDDDSGPLTPEHVLAEAPKNGITDSSAANILATAPESDSSLTHTKIHSMYDLVNALSAGGNMTQADAASKAVSLGSMDSLRSAAAMGDESAAKVLARVPSQFAENYWGGVVLSAGRPRTRLAVFAEFLDAGVPDAYTTRYLADAPVFDMGGEWLMLVGKKGQVRVRVGFDGTITAGPVGLVGRPFKTALVPQQHAAAFAAQAQAASALKAVTFEQARSEDGKFAPGGGETDTHVTSGKLEAESKKAGDEYDKKHAGEKLVAPIGGSSADKKPAKTIADITGGPSSDEITKEYAKKHASTANKPEPEPKKSGGFGGMVRKLLGGGKGGKTSFAVAPATTGIYVKSAHRTSKLAARFSAALVAATPAGFNAEYYWDELVHGPHGKTVRADAMAAFLDAGYSVKGAAEAAHKAVFASAPTLTPAKFDKSGGGGGDCEWMTISGAAGTTHICVDEGGNIAKGPGGLSGRPAKEALADHHHEMIESAKQKVKARREGNSPKGDAHGDKGHGDKAHDDKGHGDAGHGDAKHPGTSHGEMEHHAHSLGEKVMHFAHRVEPIIHFLLHPGAAAFAEIFSAKIAERFKKTEAKAQQLHGWASKRYGPAVANAAFTVAAGISLANHVIPGQAALPKHTRAALNVVPALAVAEVGLRSYQAGKAGGKAIKKGFKAVTGGLSGITKLMGNSVKGAKPAAVGASAKFKQIDPNETAIDMPFAKIQKIGKKIAKKLLAFHASDLAEHAEDVRAMSDAMESARKVSLKSADSLGKPDGKDDKGDQDGKGDKGDKGDKSDSQSKKTPNANPMPTPPNPKEKDKDDKGDKKWHGTNFSAEVAASSDGHVEAVRLARKLSKHARSGKVSLDKLKGGLKHLGTFQESHIQTAARSLGLGGPLGGKADNKKSALKRIASHLRTHAKIAAAEMHAAAGLPDKGKQVVCYDGLPRTRGWIKAQLLAAGVKEETAAQFSQSAELFAVATS